MLTNKCRIDQKTTCPTVFPLSPYSTLGPLSNLILQDFEQLLGMSPTAFLLLIVPVSLQVGVPLPISIITNIFPIPKSMNRLFNYRDLIFYFGMVFNSWFITYNNKSHHFCDFMPFLTFLQKSEMPLSPVKTQQKIYSCGLFKKSLPVPPTGSKQWAQSHIYQTVQWLAVYVYLYIQHLCHQNVRQRL